MNVLQILITVTMTLLFYWLLTDSDQRSRRL